MVPTPGYLGYAVLALAAYALVSPLFRVITTGANAIPSDVAAAISNTMLVLVAVAVILATDQGFRAHLDSPKLPYVLVAGVFLSIGILAYYRAIALGPVSVVTPIYGTFIVFSSAIGVLFLDESLTPRLAAGIGCALLGIYLVSTA
jgi:transporter family protein